MCVYHSSFNKINILMVIIMIVLMLVMIMIVVIVFPCPLVLVMYLGPLIVGMFVGIFYMCGCVFHQIISFNVKCGVGEYDIH